MKIANILQENLINLNIQSKEKLDAIKELVDLVASAKEITDKEEFLKTIIEREELETTGIGDGIAIPHGRTDTIKELVIAFGRSETGVDFKSLDNNPAYLLFLIASPQNASGIYLRTLAKISRLLKNYDFRRALRAAKTPKEIIELFNIAEQE
ncbi:MAG: PTS sugar transporter subunit IIA [bacterium]|nr:PTS sugar transporter subunit IIA [bacterium]